MTIKEYLEEHLSSGRWMSRKRIIRRLMIEGFTEQQIYREAKKLGLVTKSKGFGKDKKTYWTLDWPIDSPLKDR